MRGVAIAAAAPAAMLFILGTVSVAASDPPGVKLVAPSHPQQSRLWTDDTGRFHTKAVLLEAGEDRVRLEKPGGKLTTVPLLRLSTADRAFVRQQVPQSTPRWLVDLLSPDPKLAPARPTANLVPASLWQEMVEWVPSLLLSRLAEPIPRPGADATPAQITVDDIPRNVVYLRISRSFLNQYVRQSIHQQSELRDVIVGVPVVGTSVIEARTEVSLVPSSNQAVSDILMTGNMLCRTVGYSGPVRVYSHGSTPFEARKRLILGAEGLQTGPSVCTAQTHCEIDGVWALLPGLRGRIVARVGSRRAAQTKGQAEWEAARHAEQRVKASFDKEINSSIADLQTALRQPLAALPYSRDPPLKIHWSTQKEYLQVAMLRRRPDPANVAPPPRSGGDPDIALHVHSTLIDKTLGDSRIREAIGSVTQRLLSRRVKEVVKQKIGKDVDYHVRWSEDGAWLVFIWNSATADQQPIARTSVAQSR